ncbi:LysR substrate-binding domain-containing protein [Streptomyces sp. NPDC054871]
MVWQTSSCSWTFPRASRRGHRPTRRSRRRGCGGLGIALLPSRLVPRLPRLTVVPVKGGPVREERLVWSRTRNSPAAAAFLESIPG